MTTDRRPIRSVCVVGAGSVGLSAALAFARALPAVQIRILAIPLDPAAIADRTTAGLPFIHRFHAAIGLNELRLVRDKVAVHLLGTRFENWSPSGAPWHHVFGEHGLPAAGVPFHQIWAQLRKSGQADPLDRYSAAAILADAGKFVHPQDDESSPLSHYLYGLRLEPKAYLSQLVAEARRLGIEMIEGVVGEIDRREDAGVSAVRLEDGRSFAADLFIDCSGPSALLRSALDGDFEDWAYCLPCDRLTFASADPVTAILPFDSVAAVAEGWLCRSTLPEGAAAGLAWSSNHNGEYEADDRLRDEDMVAAETVAIRPGRRAEPWKHNVLALGDSAVALDPLHSVNLHLAESAILRALELLPGRDCHDLEVREYNRRTGEETARVRDFLALHYLYSGRQEGEFWTAAAIGRAPDSLAHTLDQYDARGRLPFYEEESFDDQSWLAVLAGLERLPKAVDPASDRVDLELAASSMADLARQLASLPARLPAYADYLRRMTA